MREQGSLAHLPVLLGKHQVLAAASGQRFSLFVLRRRETDEVPPLSAIRVEPLEPSGSRQRGSVSAPDLLIDSSQPARRCPA